MKKTSLKNDSPRPEPAKPDGVWEVSDSPFMFDPSPVPTLEEIKLARRRRRRQRSEQALQRLLAGRGKGGGAASGSVLAARLVSPEPGLAELGWVDFAAGFRSNPALSCPPGVVFPQLPMHLEATFVPGGFDMVVDFLPDGVGAVGGYVEAMSRCLPTAPPTPPVP